MLTGPLFTVEQVPSACTSFLPNWGSAQQIRKLMALRRFAPVNSGVLLLDTGQQQRSWLQGVQGGAFAVGGPLSHQIL